MRFSGKATSPVTPTCTKTPRGRIAVIAVRIAGAAAEHSKTMSKWPLSALYSSIAAASRATLITRVAPIALAAASGRSCRSVTTTSAAPASAARAAQRTPIGPDPVTSTRLPATGPAMVRA